MAYYQGRLYRDKITDLGHLYNNVQFTLNSKVYFILTIGPLELTLPV